jgi:pimeloyl-ACP methyl ester carboxylesterase
MLLTTYMLYRTAFHSPSKTQNNDFNLLKTPQMDPFRKETVRMISKVHELPYEPVMITSHDGLKLFGKYYGQKDGAPLAICFHGYRGTAARDFSGGTWIYLDAGFNLLMIDERAHGKSEGHTITFGVEERYDVLDWIHYAIDRFGPDQKIILGGISMGAGTVLMAAGLDLPDNVRGIVADCPFVTPEAIISKVSAGMNIDPKISMPFLRRAARIYGHFDLSDPSADAREAVKHSGCPILVIHGEDDRLVPCSMSREIEEAAPQIVELHTFPGAGHGLSFLVDKDRYIQITDAFFQKLDL